ncbi:hypothetical protein BCR44DRAFT_1427835 [Catenaria anguillulae PL171]|uniref:Uncharacterized protein n=1 Tax=Catenaria anguillulae PL171 TaxID=765915 RepID=A0A1Y2HYJ3_9FUNG|nr:hypothetical protein BCR44DRAFT_1427835 [Catenaria anguillulae PL171]
MRKEMLITQNANGERNSAATEPSPLETERADIHSPTLPPELDLGLDADGQELVWMMEVASSESGDSAVMTGCGCGESLHAGDAQVHDEERVPKFVEVVEDDVTPMAAGEPAFQSLASQHDRFRHFLQRAPCSHSLARPRIANPSIDSEPTAPIQLTEPHPPPQMHLGQTDLTPMASPTIGAIERHDRPESLLSPGDEALAIDTPTTEGTQALASRAVSEVQADHGRVESQLPATASAVEAAPLMPRAITEPLSPAAQTSAALPPVFRVGSDSAMSLSMTLPASADGSTSAPLRDSIDLGSSTMRTTKSSKSSLFKRFSQSFSTLTRASKHDKPRDEVVVHQRARRLPVRFPCPARCFRPCLVERVTSMPRRRRQKRKGRSRKGRKRQLGRRQNESPRLSPRESLVPVCHITPLIFLTFVPVPIRV